jgi:hypothetical protein
MYDRLCPRSRLPSDGGKTAGLLPAFPNQISQLPSTRVYNIGMSVFVSLTPVQHVTSLESSITSVAFLFSTFRHSLSLTAHPSGSPLATGSRRSVRLLPWRDQVRSYTPFHCCCSYTHHAPPLSRLVLRPLEVSQHLQAWTSTTVLTSIPVACARDCYLDSATQHRTEADGDLDSCCKKTGVVPEVLLAGSRSTWQQIR